MLPSTLLGVDFTNRFQQPESLGVIPLSVRWVRLPDRYSDEPISMMLLLPAHAKVEWYSDEDDSGGMWHDDDESEGESEGEQEVESDDESDDDGS